MDPRATSSLRRTSYRRIARTQRARRSRTRDGPPASARTFARPRLSLPIQQRAISLCVCRESTGLSSREKCASETLVSVDTVAKLIDVNEFVGSVRDVDRAGSKQQRLAPIREQWNVGRIGDRAGLETGHCGKSLRRDVRAKLDVRATLRPVEHHF